MKPRDPEAAAIIASIAPQHARLFFALRSRSRSGMSRSYSVFALSGDRLVDLTAFVARACGYRRDRAGHLVISGCGFSAPLEIAQCCGAVVHGDRAAYMDYQEI